MYKYHIYGLNVLSDLPLDCYPHEFESPDITLYFTPDTEEADRLSAELVGKDKTTILTVSGGYGSFYFCGNDSIIVCYTSDDNLKNFMIHALLGFGLSYILASRSIFLLHGCSVCIDRSAVIITGVSGAGKSSVSAALVKHGARIIADDTTRIEMGAGVPFVYPGYPIRRLYKNTIEQLGLSVEGGREVADKRSKLSFFEPNNQNNIFLEQKTPLKSIVCINPCDIPAVQLIREDTANAIRIICRNIYNYRYIFHSAYKADCISFALDVCNKIPVYTLYRPESAFTVEDQSKIILSEFYK
jgi:hypothetical protein